MLELDQVLSLSPLLPTLSPLLVRLANEALNTSDPADNFEQSGINASWVLGSCLHGLSQRTTSEWLSDVDLPLWTKTVVQKWALSGYCLEGLVSLLSKRSDHL